MTSQKSPLYEQVLESGGRMTSFAGWEMPLQFSGVIDEHHAVRNKSGIFDISHMGIIFIAGKKSKDALQALVPTDLYRIGPGESCYTVLLNPNGGIIDDLIVYDLGFQKDNKQLLLIVLNAACFSNDLDWLRKNLNGTDIELIDGKSNKAFLALQGPESIQILEKILDEPIPKLPSFGHQYINTKNLELKINERLFISKTGYTGEKGLEILLPSHAAIKLWSKLLKAGVAPCGLGSRDTLRLEAGMHLYGKELNMNTTPFEAGLGWLVHLEMPASFIGKASLEQEAREGSKRRLVGLQLKQRAIARHGYEILSNKQKIGHITSGTWSPTLNKPIAMGYVPKNLSKIGTTVEIAVRGKTFEAQVVNRAFYKRS